ncbi:OsmC family protein [Gryllotalpicola protaetiae]|uniref:OsmC family peroxiredoxin n=1 Tax=Gryllotalpicola protaetiae TaxID=2419771 RepID=A0A387BP07_9MICO|nr:OsmC family protein [Gryllotalpicola protaetiae]AYG04448.1 OsmC family peroxiredoxin [Gryllotalpicola protaetiae]
MGLEHHYAVTVSWSGNRGTGTSGYRDYGRDHDISAAGKADIAGSSDPAFRGDSARWNPEELLLAALSQCHMLSYLHAAATAGVTVVSYDDEAVGTMAQTPDGGGRFTSVTLRPRIEITDAAQLALAEELHHEAQRMCFIASSVNFPVQHEPAIAVRGGSGA